MKNIHKDNIDLHCEEVQEIMGKTPSMIQRWGILVITAVPIVLFVGSFLFRSPETVDGRVMIAVTKRKIKAQMLVIDTEVWKIKTGQRVMVSLDRYSSSTYGHLNGYVVNISDIPNQNNEYAILINLPQGFTSDTNVTIPVHPRQRGKGKIIVGNVRLLHNLFEEMDGFKPY